MRERYLRAIWFALFATVGLIVGGFVVGYGAALLSAPPLAPVVLPTVAAGVQAEPGTSTPTDTPWMSDDAMAVPAGRTPAPTVGTYPAMTVPPAAPSPRGETGSVGLEASLESVDVNPALGGVEVILDLHNDAGESVSFSFWPDSDLVLSDSDGRRYALRWAEYDGVVAVPANGTIRLVRAFFAGLPGEDTEYITVKVSHPPQLPERRWQVTVERGGD